MMTLIPNIMLDPANRLYFPISELQSTKHMFKSFQWCGEEGESKAVVYLSDGTVIIGEFESYRMMKGTITYPNKTSLSGIFTKSCKSAIGILKEGQFRFSGGEILKIRLNGLSIDYIGLFTDKEVLIENFYEHEVVYKKNNRIIKVNAYGMTEGKLDNTGELLSGVKYLFHGPFYASFDFNKKPTGDFFNLFGNEPVTPLTSHSFDVEDLNKYVKNKSKNKKVISFELADLIGQFHLFVDNKTSFDIGKGFYKNSLIKQEITVIVRQELMFIVEDRLFNLQDLKTYINSLCSESTLSDLEEENLFDSYEEDTLDDLSEKQIIDNYVNSYERLEDEYEEYKKHSAFVMTQFNRQYEEIYNKKQMFNQTQENLMKEINRLNEKLAAMRQQNMQLTRNHSAFDNELAEKNRMIDKLSKSNNKLKTIYNNKEHEFDELVKNVNSKEIKLRKDVEHLNYVIAMNQAEIRKITDVLEQNKEKVAMYSNELDSVKNQQKKDQKRLKLEKQTNKELVAEIKELKSRLEAHQSSIESNYVTIEELRKANEKEKNRADDLQDKIYELEANSLCIKKEFFKGQIVNGLRQGMCEEKGDNYYFLGMYDKGVKTGKGKLIQHNIEQEGEFKDDLLHGEAVYKDNSNNKLIKGRFEKGQFTGTELTIGEISYKGRIRNNKTNGKGYFQFKNGFTFEGDFEDDQIINYSFGTMVDINSGSEYIVSFAEDEITTEDEDIPRIFTIDYSTGSLIENK